MSIKIVVDSASDILPSECEAMGIYHVPLSVKIGDTVYKDAVDLSHHEFYEKLIESDELPQTSQATIADFSDVFGSIVNAGDTVLAIVLSSKLSGTYQSAMIAASDYPGKVSVIDSESATLGQRLLVQIALKMVNDGCSMEEIVATVEQEKKKVRILAVLDTLEYLKKGGRISSAVAFAGGLLSIKPVITVNEGEVALIGKARGSKNSANLLRKLILDGPGVDFSKPYCVAYTGLSDVILQKYIEDNGDLWQTETKELPCATVGCAIGTHIGPGAIAVAFIEK